jgi:NADH dehydrogenase
VHTTKILICGGGYVGVYSALALRKKLGRRADITLVAPDSFMVYQPFLPEAASGNIEPRHVVVPLRPVLKGTRVITGRVRSLDHARRTATVAPTDSDPYELSYDAVVLGVGSVSRVLPVPGLAERGIGFKSVAEAIHLRNHVLACMDAAESTTDRERRRRLLTFTFVGGGFAGVEALAELEDMARYACRFYPSIERSDMRWVLVEAAGSILPEIGTDLADYALERLRSRPIEVHLETRLDGAEKGEMQLSDGEVFASETLVWTTGVRAHSLAGSLGFSSDERGRVIVDEFLRIKGVQGAWAAGDCAAVPDLIAGGISPPTAQHALRQARRLGDNLAAQVRGKPLREFRYRNMGQLVSLGRYKGVAQVMFFKLRGFPAWFLHRTYHVLMVPTFNRKARVLADWTVALFFKRDVVQLGALSQPREAFEQALEDR